MNISQRRKACLKNAISCFMENCTITLVIKWSHVYFVVCASITTVCDILHPKHCSALNVKSKYTKQARQNHWHEVFLLTITAHSGNSNRIPRHKIQSFHISKQQSFISHSHWQTIFSEQVKNISIRHMLVFSNRKN
jgi:hypothetical protein